MRSHSFEVPLDWSRPDSSKIKIFVREVVDAARANDNLPALCYFRGGPGFEVPAPTSNSGWLAQLVKRYRVFLLDQRGTGLSTPVDEKSLDASKSPEQLAEYLACFRADSIVRDAEYVRRTLLGENGRWTTSGQSFGGFCTLTYLSFFPDHLDGSIITGGFAGVERSAIEVYRALRERVVERNEWYFRQFPEDRGRVTEIIRHLDANEEMIAPDWRLTSRQFRVLGNDLGAKHGAAAVHSIVERMSADLHSFGTLTRWSLVRAMDALRLSTNPIYALLHESIYNSATASEWAADRAINEDARFADADAPLFTGEMIFPWMFDELPALRPFAQAAHALAKKSDWPDLYDVESLKSCRVPVVGTIYFDDLYVDRDFAVETANLLGNCKYWITNEYEHGGYADDPERVMGQLFSMLDDLQQRDQLEKTRV